jgi:hypothetical protein
MLAYLWRKGSAHALGQFCTILLLNEYQANLPFVRLRIATPQCRACPIKREAGHLGGKINPSRYPGLPQERNLHLLSRLIGIGNP